MRNLNIHEKDDKYIYIAGKGDEVYDAGDIINRVKPTADTILYSLFCAIWRETNIGPQPRYVYIFSRRNNLYARLEHYYASSKISYSEGKRKITT